MARQSSTSHPTSVSFDVDIDMTEDFVKPKGKCPTKLLLQRKLTETRYEENDQERAMTIKQRLIKAEQNKKDFEAARLLRIHQRQECCRSMASKMEKLLEQDAKRQGKEGTHNIKAMSRREAGAMIQSLHRDIQQLGAELSHNLEES